MIKILIIDDDEFTREELGDYLQDEGYNVYKALDGLDGLKKFREILPEVVLTDVNMPRLDGFELLKEIKKIKPEARVIILTGHGDEKMVIRALKDGANDYIKKPIELKLVTESINKCVESVKKLKRTTFNFRNIQNLSMELIITNNLDEIYGITNYITNFNYIYFTYPLCEKIKLAIIETLRNSIEHGNLGIGYNEKNFLLEDNKFNQTLRDRCDISPYKDRKINIKYTINKDGAEYIVTDEGEGFDWKNLPNPEDPSNIFKRNGRGIMLVKLIMDKVIFNEKGNQITIFKKSDLVEEKKKNIWINHYISDKHDLR